MHIRYRASVRRRGLPRLLAFALMTPVVIALAACSTTPTKPAATSGPFKQGGGYYKIGNPYQINGIWYYPAENEKYDSIGIASWYGPGFHGQKTANGEIFDENQISAAHPTLPMPVIARVTNLENGKSIVLRINDRGPFASGREIDLSKKAAEVLGFKQKGTAKVRVQYIGRAPLEGGIGDGMGVAETFVAPPVETPAEERRVAGTAPVTSVSTVATAELAPPIAPMTAPANTLAPVSDAPPAASQVEQVGVGGPGHIYVQAGSFQNLQNAESVRQQLSGVGRVEIQTTMVDGTPFYRVRVGPLSDVPAADSSLQTVIAQGHRSARIVVD
ncbi:MAG: septal ring lytic transglycosylase RlpA family protein [Alphaproteobacteria bacterium]|nr:septal ring lytic transglycosylase RlpA family protein [Alphaproteobacteria bacterium]MDX5417063.1 septal ring lytic transglycosylase RlpA family protein [Alphaproteobacteria bacterium]MDX5494468.1 septal ring lytic transglycosylase RlpA family protein [Alphaproteobacteria bacterium]